MSARAVNSEQAAIYSNGGPPSWAIILSTVSIFAVGGRHGNDGGIVESSAGDGEAEDTV